MLPLFAWEWDYHKGPQSVGSNAKKDKMADPMKWICLLWQICVQCLMGKWVKKYGKVFVSMKPRFAVKTANFPRLGRQKDQFLSQEANQLTDLDNHMLYMETETLIGKSVTYNSVQNTFFN